MSDTKVDEKPVSNKSDKLEKQVASIAFTVRKIKDKLEEQLGMDIDGDGRIGSGPYKKLGVMLLIAGMAMTSIAANTNIEVWAGTEATPTAGVHSDGGIFGAYLVGDGTRLTSVPGTGSTIAPGSTWIGNAASNATAVALSGDVTVITNGTTAIGARKVLGTMLPQATDGQILVGMSVGGSNVIARSITGDITLTSNGVSAVASLPAISGASLTALTAANITTTGTKHAGKVTVVSTLSTTVFDFVSGICTQAVTTP